MLILIGIALIAAALIIELQEKKNNDSEALDDDIEN